MAPANDAKTKSKTKGRKGSKRLLSGPAAAAMKAAKATAKPNPFETIWSRRKFDVLGKRPKGAERRVGLARSVAVEKRKKTLLTEYKQSAKSSLFMDKRIGEKDDTLQEFDKAVLRLQRERQVRLKKSSKFNLSDGEEDDSNAYHAHLSEKDDFEDEIPLDDDEDTRNVADTSRHLSLYSVSDHAETVLNDAQEDIHKSKKQVMQEIILKSKYYKAQKAKAKEEDDHLMQKLDDDFTSLAQSEALRSLTRPNKMNALKALLNKNDTKQSLPEGISNFTGNDSTTKELPDVYDKLVKELVLDRRAYASDRTKTPEEIAQEEKERLEELEKKRQERMLGTDDSSDELSDEDGDDEKLISKNIRSLSGDDLGDSFSIGENDTNKKGWIDDIYNKNELENHDRTSASSEDGESDEDDEGYEEDEDDEEDEDIKREGDSSRVSSGEKLNLSSGKEWEQSDDEDLSLDSDEEEDLDDSEVTTTTTTKPYPTRWDDSEVRTKKFMKIDLRESDSTSCKMNAVQDFLRTKDESLPYVIDAPKNLTELCTLLDNRSDSEVLEAINRIRACNSIKLAADNRRKMQVFYGVLLQYFAVLATRSPLNVKIINSLVRPLIDMSAETPYFAAICARQRLVHIRNRFCEEIKDSDKSCWPSLKTLILLRLWSLIFPCSDFRHVVTTPALLLTCEYLMRCPIKSGRDIAVGSFLCSMVLTITKQSRKFCPEAMLFLQTLLLSTIELKLGQHQHAEFNNLMELKMMKPRLLIHDEACNVHPIEFFKVMDMHEDSPFFESDDFKAGILMSVAETLKGFVTIYEGLSSFAEIVSPISLLVHRILQDARLPNLLRNKMQDVFDLMKMKTREHYVLRQPLQMRKQKPVPIKLLNPKFEENFVKGRNYDPDRERAEMKKLKKLLKSEKKGAIRELRKDSQFLSSLKEADRLNEKKERDEQYGKTLAFLQEQEHAFKSGQLGKGGKRRRK